VSLSYIFHLAQNKILIKTDETTTPPWLFSLKVFEAPLHHA